MEDKDEANSGKDETVNGHCYRTSTDLYECCSLQPRRLIVPFCVSRASPERAQNRLTLGWSCVFVGRLPEVRSPRIGLRWCVGDGYLKPWPDIRLLAARVERE